MKSLNLIKAAVVKPAVTAISVFYIVVVAILVVSIIISGGFYRSFSMRGVAPLFLFIFAMIHIVYLFKFSQNVCGSRKTCFIAAIYTILAISIITVILDMLIMFFAKIGGMSIHGYDMGNIFFTITVLTSIHIVTASFGMLFGMAWYRLSKLARICIGASLGVLFIMGPPLLVMLADHKLSRENMYLVRRIEDILYAIHTVFAGNIWTVLANIGLATVVVGIFYLVIRKAQIIEIK